MTQLVKYEAACRAVAEAVSIDEAKEFRDQSEAMRAYAKQAKNKQLEVQAAEIRIRAERRIGELMAAQREAFGTAQGRRSDLGFSATQVEAAPVTLAEAGIDKNLADRARKYAAIPEDEFNGIVDDWKGRVEQENHRVTVNLLAAGDRAAEQATPIEQAENDADAKQRREIGKLTTEAMIDEIIGLRADLNDAKAKNKAIKAERDDLKAKLADLTADDKGEVIRRLQASLKNAENAKWRATEEQARAMKQVYALKKRVAELEQMGIQISA